MDKFGRPVIDGLEGELLCGGRVQGSGYLNNPGRTASSWVPDPFGDSQRTFR